ncbi:hypothetical protein D9613_010625 [Agrocybe pediades]|uniref:Uncharacterized protein n=1 Tax=Agrocybe pediades TaxID=84607 RepID=A0A8H4QFC4_9AGAR|nr:hypothetical protein D9613_010625 [Agrocybe pediades]
MPFSLKPTSSSASSKTKDVQRAAFSSKPSSKPRASNKPSDNSKANEKAVEKNKASKPQGSFLKAFKKMIPCASKKAMKKNFDDVEVVDLTVEAVTSLPRPISIVEETRPSEGNNSRRFGERRVDASNESRKGSPPPPPFSPQEMEARKEAVLAAARLRNLIKALEGLETGVVAQVEIEEACDDSQDVVACYALSPEDEEERTPEAVGEFGMPDNMDMIIHHPSPAILNCLFHHQTRPPVPLSLAALCYGFDTVQVVFFKEENTDDGPKPDAAHLDRLDEEEESQDSLIAQQDLLGPMPDAGYSHLSDEEEDAAMIAQKALAAAQEFEDLLNGF